MSVAWIRLIELRSIIFLCTDLSISVSCNTWKYWNFRVAMFRLFIDKILNQWMVKYIIINIYMEDVWFWYQSSNTPDIASFPTCPSFSYLPHKFRLAPSDGILSYNKTDNVMIFNKENAHRRVQCHVGNSLINWKVINRPI